MPEDPKSVLRAASGANAPSINSGKEVEGGYLRRLCSRYLVNGVYIWYQKDGFPNNEGILQINFKNYGLIRQEWASFGVLAGCLMRWRNLEGAPLWINGKHEGKITRNHEVLAHIDSSTWRPGEVHVGGGDIAEAKKKKPVVPEQPVTEDPKAFFQRMITTGKAAALGKSVAYADVLQYMPPDFKRAFELKQEAEWKQDDMSFTDNWPSYDDDDDDEEDDTSNPWHEVYYYFDYRTEGGIIYLVAMSGDMDGDHDFCDEAEIGTPEAAALEKEYGSDGYFKALEEYYEWVANRGRDPLGKIRDQHPRVTAKKTFIAGFVKEGERFKLWGIRNVTNPPSPPPVLWPDVLQKAAEDEEWKKAIEYCLLDADGFTEATEDQIVNEGGKWDKSKRLVIKFSWDDHEQAANDQNYIRTQAQEALQRLRAER